MQPSDQKSSKIRARTILDKLSRIDGLRGRLTAIAPLEILFSSCGPQRIPPPGRLHWPPAAALGRQVRSGREALLAIEMAEEVIRPHTVATLVQKAGHGPIPFN